MSFSSPGGAEEVLSYYIRAHDSATPIFRAFGAEVEATTRKVQGSLLEMNRALAAQVAETRKLSAAAGEAGAKQAVFQRETRAAGADAAAFGGRVHGATDEMTAHRKAVQEAGYALSGFSGQLGPVGRSLDQTAKHAQLFRDQGIDYMLAGFAGLAAATVAYGTKANITFDNLGKSIQQQAGTSQRATQQLLGDVKKVSTESPAAYQQIAQAVAAQYRLFHSSNAVIQKNSDLFLAFSEQAKRNVVPSITGISNVMRDFHPKGMSAVDVMDQLVNLAQKSQRPLGSYLDVITKYGPQLQAMGLSFTQTVGLMDAFSKHGIDATSMGRGLSTAMSNAEKQIKAAAAATQDHGAKLLQYQDAVSSAQIRVNELNTKIEQGKGDTKLYSDQLVVAQNQLGIAKDKLTAYTGALKNNSDAHLTVAQVIGKEAQAIEGARSKNDALNLSIQAFGARLGPQMALALWHNKAGLDALDKSLGSSKGKTEDLAKAQRDTLHGQLMVLEHDFTLLASKVGLPVSGLKDFVHVLGDVVKAVEGLPKPILDAIFYGGGGGALALLTMRHTPLGGIVSRATGAEGWIQTLLTGKSQVGQSIATGTGVGGPAGVGGIWGVLGPARAGSLSNPIMVRVEGSAGMGLGAPAAEGAAMEGAAAQDAAAAETRLASGVILPPGVAAPAISTAGEVAGGAGIVGAAGAETGLLTTIRAGLPSVISGAMKGGIIAAVGGLGAQMLGSIIGGRPGHDVSSIGGGAAMGAGAGMLLGPLGALAGGLFGGSIAAANTLFAGPQMHSQLTSSIMGTLSGIQQHGGPHGGDTGNVYFPGSQQVASQTQAASAALKEFDATIQSVHGDLSKLTPAQLQQVQREATALAADPSLDKFKGKLNEVWQASETALTQKTVPNFKNLEAQAGQSLRSIQVAIDQTTSTIQAVLPKGSQDAQKQTSAAFQLASLDIAKSMAQGVVSTSAGIAKIDEFMAQALQAVGVKAKPSDIKAIGLSSAMGLVAYNSPGGGGTAVTSPGANATGGRVPGAVGPDNWTLVDPSGRAAGMVGGGEILIGNRHTEARVDQKLAIGAALGLWGSTSLGSEVAGERVPHSARGYATGGHMRGFGAPSNASSGGGVQVGGSYVFPFPRSEAFTWERIDQGQDLLGPPGGPVLAIAPGVVSQASDRFGGFGPFYPTEQVTAGPLSGKGVYYGHTKISRTGMVNAGDVIAHTQPRANDWTAAPAGWLEIGLMPYGSMQAGQAIAPLLHSLAAGHRVTGNYGGATGSVWQNIRTPKWTGPGGPLGQFGQAVLAKVAAASNAYGQQATGSVGGGSVSGAGIHSGTWFQVASQIAKRHGWGPGEVQDWYGVEQLEDASLSLTAKNPTSPAYGLAQFINGPSEYYTYGGNPNTIGGQLTAMANYMAGRYGTPSAALAFHQSHPYYEQGGRVKYAGAYGAGGAFTATSPTMAMFGDNGPETVLAIPHAQTGGAFSANVVGAHTYPGSSSSTSSHGPKPTTRINPITGKIETHLPDEWLVIEQQAQQQRHALSAARKTEAAHQAAHVTDVLTLAGLIAGTLDITRKTAGSEHLRAGGREGLLEATGATTEQGFKGILSALRHELGIGSLSSTRGLLAGLEHAGAGRAPLTSRRGQELTAVLTAAAKGEAGAFAAQQNAFASSMNIAQMLEALPAGSTAKSLGLSRAQLKASGLTPAMIKHLSGAGTGPGAYAQQVSYLTNQEIPKYQQDAQHLQGLYRDALKDHNRKLADALKKQLDQVTQAQLKAYTDLAAAQVNQVEAVYQQAQTTASAQQAGSDVLGAIQSLPAGTNLGAMGLTPAVLAGMGLNPGQASGLAGSGLGYLQNLAQQQNGKLTPAQMQAAQQGVAAQNALLSSQRTTDVGALSQMEQELPGLKGQAALTAQQHITDLAKSILGLTDTMNQNNNALTALTQATNANTSATGQMTGTVGYSYQGQDYVAGGRQTSEAFVNLHVGS